MLIPWETDERIDGLDLNFLHTKKNSVTWKHWRKLLTFIAIFQIHRKIKRSKVQLIQFVHSSLKEKKELRWDQRSKSTWKRKQFFHSHTHGEWERIHDEKSDSWKKSMISRKNFDLIFFVYLRLCLMILQYSQFLD